MIYGRIVDHLASPLGRYLQHDYMRRLGIENSRRISKRFNKLRYRRRLTRHIQAYELQFDDLLGEHGKIPQDYDLQLRDGWAINRSGTLPHLDCLLEEAGKIIAERGGRIHAHAQQPYFRSLLFPGDEQANPSFANFALSAPVLKIVADYMGMVPVLSKTRPPGVRMMESNAHLSPTPDVPYNASQLFHLDLHDSPLIYIVVLLDEVTEQSGPWSFLPASVSADVERKMNYRRRGVPYRITDEMMYGHVSRDNLIVFTGKPGDVLFIDSSHCFHYGSRNAVQPRFLMMYGFTTPCRADMTQTFMRPKKYEVSPCESRLRQMVLAVDN